MNFDNELWLMNIQGVFQLWFFLIAWGRERGCGDTGVENWWHLIGLKKTYNRYSVGRKKARLVVRVVRCSGRWSSLFPWFTLLSSQMCFWSSVSKAGFENEKAYLNTPWQQLLNSEKQPFPDSSHFHVAGSSMPWDELISSGIQWFQLEIDAVVLDQWLNNLWLFL